MTRERDRSLEDDPNAGDEPDADDLVGRAEKLRERAEELEEEEQELDELEATPREWLEHQEKLHWPPLEPEAEQPGDDD